MAPITKAGMANKAAPIAAQNIHSALPYEISMPALARSFIREIKYVYIVAPQTRRAKPSNAKREAMVSAGGIVSKERRKATPTRMVPTKRR